MNDKDFVDENEALVTELKIYETELTEEINYKPVQRGSAPYH